MAPLPRLLMLAAPLCVHAAPQEVLRLGTQERAPYVVQQPDGSLDGLAVRVVECALKRLGQPYRLELLPWERAQVMTRGGALDGFFPGTALPERRGWTQESAPIASQYWVWYLRAGSTLDPLSPQFRATARVGAHFGSVRLKTLQAEGYQVVLSPQTDKALLQAFAAGRADAVLGADLAMEEALRELKLDPAAFRVVPVRESPQLVFFATPFVEAHPGFLERFNVQAGACRKSLDR